MLFTIQTQKTTYSVDTEVVKNKTLNTTASVLKTASNLLAKASEKLQQQQPTNNNKEIIYLPATTK